MKEEEKKTGILQGYSELMLVTLTLWCCKRSRGNELWQYRKNLEQAEMILYFVLILWMDAYFFM